LTAALMMINVTNARRRCEPFDVLGWAGLDRVAAVASLLLASSFAPVVNVAQS